jgi:DNA-directed RNA polymerase specialized sigma24 family protein
MSRKKGQTAYDYDRILKLRRTGLSQQAIATRMGCSLSTVKSALRAAREKEARNGKR